MPPTNPSFPNYMELQAALMFVDEPTCAQYLLNKKILPTKNRCLQCNLRMTLQPCPTTKYSDECCWKCTCGTTRSIRAGSILQDSNISFSKFILLLNCFSEELLPPLAAARCGVTEKTARRFYKMIRIQTTEELSTSPKIGGPGTVVEIDEAKFGKQKYHRGRLVEGTWVLGGVERHSTRCFMTVLPNNKRDAATLLPIISQYVEPGTTIITDCWRAYSGLQSRGYVHLTVNHSRNFVDPVTGAHTNGIEGSWTHAKRAAIRRGGRRGPDSLDMDLASFVWMKQHGLTGARVPDRIRFLFSRDLPRVLNYRNFQ